MYASDKDKLCNRCVTFTYIVGLRLNYYYYFRMSINSIKLVQQEENLTIRHRHANKGTI